MSDEAIWKLGIGMAIIELEKTLAERRVRIAMGKAPGDAYLRLDNMANAVRILKIAEKITYFETKES